MAIGDHELQERVRVLTRLREALVRRRDRVRRCLDLLDAEDREAAPAERLEFRVDLEQKVLREIASFERAVDPLQALYRENDPRHAERIPELIEGLDRTRERLAARASLDERLLQVRLEELQQLRREVSAMRSDLAARRRPLPISGRPVLERTLIDITA